MCSSFSDIVIWQVVAEICNYSRYIYVLFENISLYIANEGLKYVGLCLVLAAFEQGAIFIMPYCFVTVPHEINKNLINRVVL